MTKENFREYTGKTEGNNWDFYRFNIAHFRHIENCIMKLQEMGIEADLIVIHPYDRWGFSQMTPDEISYKGNIQHGWGNISGKELVRRFWEGVCRGGYPQHRETYLSPDNVLWWSHGGRLHGESHKRFGFLFDIVKAVPGGALTYYAQAKQDEVCGIPDGNASNKMAVKDYYLFYYSFMQPSFRQFYFDDDSVFEAEVIDTWEMTIEKAGSFSGKFTVTLPGKQYMAIQLKKIMS